MSKHEMIIINDFRIILNNNSKSKTTMVESYISSGCINETKENAGISHLLEHVVTEGWDKCGKEGCQSYWKKKGVITNASTGQTTVQYYMHGLEEYSMKMIDYIISISIDPIITAKRINKEKIAVKNELMMHDSHPLINLFTMMNNMLFRLEGLQYQDDMKLQIKNLSKFNTKNLSKWCKQFYGAGNMIFVISGNFNKNEVISYLKKKLKKSNPIKMIPRYSDIFKPGIDVMYLKDTNIDNTNIMFAFPSPIYQTDKEVFYIEFFKEFIGSGVTSLLMEELREKNQWIYSVSLDNYTNPYGTYLTINISTENKYIEKVVLATISILKQLSRGSFDSHTLEYVKNRYMVDHYDTCQTTSFLTQFYGDQYINQIYNGENVLTIKHFPEVADTILKIKENDFVLFVKKLLIFANMKIAYNGKKKVSNLKSLVLKRIE
jgi:predicted Zn-dependent peptidase